MIDVESGALCWQVHRYDVRRPLDDVAGLLRRDPADLAVLVGSQSGLDGRRFLLGPDGRPDLRVNACLASPKWRSLGALTARDYTYSLVVWLNFLLTTGVNWWEASEDQAEEFLFWRVTDPANEDRVEAGTFVRDLAGLRKFYKWMKRHGVVDPFDDFDTPRVVRHADVKWFDPGGYARWRDLGIRGLDLSGRPDKWWRGRNEQRDKAFCDGLYGCGLRVSEWASVVLPELAAHDRRRGYYTGQLADACAKGGYGHPYWFPRSVMKGVQSYTEGPRAAAVRRAQAVGRYEKVRDRWMVLAARGSEAVVLEGGRRGRQEWAWNDIGPDTRLRLFRETPQGLEPLALWLNEDGLPRDGRGWEHTFEVANGRIAALGLEGFACTAHMLRHSFALKWYSISKLVHAARIGHLAPAERDDFREQFGDAWHLVQTMLGHRSVETTKSVYLEPFGGLDVEVLLAHAEGFPIDLFMAEVFVDHPFVRSDPLAVIR